MTDEKSGGETIPLGVPWSTGRTLTFWGGCLLLILLGMTGIAASIVLVATGQGALGGMIGILIVCVICLVAGGLAIVTHQRSANYLEDTRWVHRRLTRSVTVDLARVTAAQVGYAETPGLAAPTRPALLCDLPGGGHHPILLDRTATGRKYRPIDYEHLADALRQNPDQGETAEAITALEELRDDRRQ